MVRKIKEHVWEPLMDADKNPLAGLPPITKYQLMMVLAMMWSFIFCAMVGWMLWFPYWIIGHILLLSIGAYITNHTFKTYNTTHRDMYRSPDKTHALHDDIWGG
jgi:hypothetical protein